MLSPDIPCACVNCGVVYADARARFDGMAAEQEEVEQFLERAQVLDNRFVGRPCAVCSKVLYGGGRTMSGNYRLLLGPLFVPRKII